MSGAQGPMPDPYFRQCKDCGQAIQMRQMPGGLWVAFDDVERVHDCHNQSAYNDMYLEATRTLALSGAPSTPPPVSSEMLPTTTPLVVAPLPPRASPGGEVVPPRRARVSPALWLVGLLLLVGVGGWFTASRISLRPLGNSQATPAGAVNTRADDPADTTTVPTAPASSTSPPAVNPGDSVALIDLQEFDFVYVRSGPGIAYPEVARVYGARTPFDPQGRSESREWIFGAFEDGTQGWVKTEFVRSENALDELPLQANQQPEGIAARIDLQEYDFIYVQQGAGVDFDEVSRVEEPGTSFEALARSVDGEWIFVRLEDGTPGWIMRDFVISDESLELLPAYESRSIGAP